MKRKVEVFKVRRSRSQPKLAKPDVYAPPTDKVVAQLIARAKEITEQLDEVKPLYNELDQITFALVAVKNKLARYGVTVVDNFEVKNTQFKTASFRRFELSWVGGRR